MDKPTLIQGAYGVRGRYQTIEVIPAHRTPLLTSNWIYTTHQRVEAMGYDRCRIKAWIDHSDHYLTL
jgi:hypothetical protein